MNNIYLLYNFNNYYNRKLIRYSTLSEYLTAVGDDYKLFQDVINFTPADGISTQHLFNFTVAAVPPIDENQPDYALIVDDSDNIMQRWFVVDSHRTRAGQYNLDFYRDTVAEAWNNIQDAPIFVEKGIVAQNDPMIFNKEDLTFNQIKTHEYPIMDEIGVQWIVGYMAPSASGDKSFDPYVNADYEYSTLSDYPYYQYATGTKMYTDITSETYKIWADNATGGGSWLVTFNSDFNSVSEQAGASGSSLIVNDSGVKWSFSAMCKSNTGAVRTAVKTQLGIVSDVLSAENGKTIKVGTTYYQISVNDPTYRTLADQEVTVDSTIYNGFQRVIVAANNKFPFLKDTELYPLEGNAESFVYTIIEKALTISIREIPNTTAINYKISTTKRSLRDQPYCMFAMPYGYCTIGGVTGLTKDFKEISMAVAKDISKEFGGDSPALYDLQLLPYCPIREYIDQTQGLLTVSGKTADADYSLITQGNANVGIIFWCTTSKATFNNGVLISVSDYKIDNETKMYRLCSPNYNGQFEFSAAANGGINGFIVDFTYKPYNPYIHVVPKFGRLYGSDFGDARGLICGGQFDLPQTSEAWATYERSNSNYNSIFDRQIANLQVQQDVAKKQDIASAFAGTVQGAGAGAALGGMYGGGVGAIAGGIGGAALSAIAGVVDVVNSEKLRTETMDYTKDMFNYNMGNIQAMPDGLTKVGSLTNNYKKFPFIEVYEATETEVEALKNKIRYNGMTVGRIDTIATMSANTWTYSNGWNYFKGQLIRADIPNEDWHFINTVKDELDRGIYIGG